MRKQTEETEETENLADVIESESFAALQKSKKPDPDPDPDLDPGSWWSRNGFICLTVLIGGGWVLRALFVVEAFSK